MAILTSLNSTKKLAIYQYDFSVHGGAVAAISVAGSMIPSGSIISQGLIHVVTAVEGTSSTLAIHVEGAEDILAATAEATLSIGALVDTVPAGTAATSIITTSNIEAITFTPAVAVLTAGKVTVYLEYFPVDS